MPSDPPHANGSPPPIHKGMKGLMALIDTLRGESGCPWDRKQTPRSLSVYLVEEVYELVDAIAANASEATCEEMGDVLFHLMFLASIYRDAGQFDIEDVADRVVTKMVRRHPHVFGSRKVTGVEEVKKNWQQIKMDEKQADAGDGSVLDGVPVRSPALLRAYRISERAAKAGFEWNDVRGVLHTAEQEWSEFTAALAGAEGSEDGFDKACLEFGDVLFTLVNVGRLAGIHPETALSAAIRKFEARFRHMERALTGSGQKMDEASRRDIDSLWDAAKKAVG